MEVSCEPMCIWRPRGADVGEFGGAGVDVGDGLEIDAELVLGLAGGDVFVGFGVHVRVHPHGDRGDHAEVAGDFVEVAELVLGFDVEGVDACFEGVDDFVAGLADAGEGALRDRRRRLMTRNSSPPETMSKPAPSPARRRRTERFEFALTA